MVAIADFSPRSYGGRTMFEAHFQTFEDPEGGVALTARLSAFREELARRKLTGFVIPRADQQQNEYVPPSEERLAWLTGFTGSAGLAVVLTERPRCSSTAATPCRPPSRSIASLAVSSRWSIRRRKSGLPASVGRRPPRL